MPLNNISSVTKDRFKKADRIIQSLRNDTHRAIAVEANFVRCTFKSDIAAAYDNTFQAWSLNVIRDSLLVELVMILMRMVDNDDRNATLRSIAAIISEKEVIELLNENARDWVRQRTVHNMGPIDEISLQQNKRLKERHAESEAEKINKMRIRAIRRIKRLTFDPLIPTLKAYRHKHIAHNGMATSTGAKMGDASKLLKKITPIVEDLSIVVTGHHHNFEDANRAWKDRANRFWRFTVMGLKTMKAEKKKKTKARIAELKKIK